MGLKKYFFFFYLVSVPVFGNWELVSNEDGIKIFEKYSKGSSVLAFKGEMVSDSNIHELFTVIYDPKRKKDFLQNVVEFRPLRIVSSFKGVSYVKVGSNFPFIDDRDVILESNIDVRAKEKKILIFVKNSSLKIVPEQEDTVRIPELQSLWTFEALGPSKTKVSYQSKTDPGGLIPKWLVNFANKTLPFKTLQKMRRLSKEKESFKDTALYVKYLIDFKPFLGENHPSGQRSKKEAIGLRDRVKDALKEACDSGKKEACAFSKSFNLEYLK